jgi:hypothetical protein
MSLLVWISLDVLVLGKPRNDHMGFVVITLAAAKGLLLHKSISFLSEQRDFVL